MKDYSRKHVVVFGSSSGFGKAVCLKLLYEGCFVTGLSRRPPDFTGSYDAFRHLSCDVEDESALGHVLDELSKPHIGSGDWPDELSGLVLNAGGPPTGSASELSYKEYRSAYRLVFEWKVQAVNALLPRLKQAENGRIIFIESQSLKQPIPGLVLSNSMRLAVAGFAKTLSREVARTGLTVNIVAPGSHNTPAIKRIIHHKSNMQEQSEAEVRRQMEDQIPAGRFGSSAELAAFISWLLSEESSFITGQTLSHDGGNISHIFG